MGGKFDHSITLKRCLARYSGGPIGRQAEPHTHHGKEKETH